MASFSRSLKRFSCALLSGSHGAGVDTGGLAMLSSWLHTQVSVFPSSVGPL